MIGERLAAYAKRWLITSWVAIWILAALAAPGLYEDYPQMLRFVIALGFFFGSVAGEIVFIPLVVAQKIVAFDSVIAIGIFTNALMGAGFFVFATTPTAADPVWQVIVFYSLLLPGSIMWFSGGMYLLLGKFYPEMRFIQLSLRPWRRD